MPNETRSFLLRSAVESLPTYKAGKAPAQVPGGASYKLSSNEHHLGPLPGIVDSIKAAAGSPEKYPDPVAKDLVEALSNYLGVPTERVITGTGASELLGALVHLTIEDGTDAIYPWPSFEMYPLVTGLNDANRIEVPLTVNESHDLDAMAGAITSRTRLILLCSPNNPTGPALTQDSFDRFMARVPEGVLVVLDQAYWEFITDPDAVDGLAMSKKYSNLVLLRTFSKAHGLAGLRVGYCVGHPNVIHALSKIVVPFGVNTLAQRAAIESVERIDEISARVKSIAEARDALARELRRQGWSVPDAQGNFVWMPLENLGEAFENACHRQGLAVRRLTGGVRISIGPQEAMDRVLKIAREFREAHYS